MNDTPSTSDEIKSCFASVSCQTDLDDPNKAVIDKLRRRIEDLEQDLKETKEKLNLQQQHKEGNSDNSKKDVRFQVEGKFQGEKGNPVEDSEKRICELKSQWEREKQDEVHKLKSELQTKYDQELAELHQKENVRRQQFADNLKRVTNEQKHQELEEAKQILLRQHRQELDEIRNVFEAKSREFEESTNTLQRRQVARMNEMRAIFEQRRLRELEETKSSLIRCHDMELNELRAVMKRERESVISLRDHERVLRDSVREAKRKQWCCNCESEASYPCCWNTSYCSRHCQHVHWEHHRLHCSRNLVLVNNTRVQPNNAGLTKI